MSVRQLVLAWVMAGCLVVGLGFGINVLAKRAQAQSFSQTDIIVIGSSLMRFAVPVEASGPDSLLGDGRSHRRFSLAAITEEQTLDLLEAALDQRRSLIFVEANVFLFDFANTQSTSWRGKMSIISRVPAQEARDAVRGLKGQPILSAQPDSDRLKSIQTLHPAKDALRYPLILRAPRTQARLTRLAERARQQGASIVFILPPRSAFAAARIGPGASGALQARAEALASRLNFKLFATNGMWSDAEFADAAHMNANGRQHFLRELRFWWAQAS